MKLKTGYSDESPDDLYHLAVTVAGNMVAKPIWAALKPSAAELNAMADDLGEALKMVGPGRKQAIAAAKATVAKALCDIAMNAPQIEGVTDTDLAMLGLPIARTPVRETTAPHEPGNVRLSHGETPGELAAKCDSLGPDIRLYVSQWTLDPNGDAWTDGPTSPNSRDFKFIGLPRGKDVWIRLAAINSVGQSAWSAPATIMAT